jgi:DNA polymerase
MRAESEQFFGHFPQSLQLRILASEIYHTRMETRMPSRTTNRTARAAVQKLESLQRSGVGQLPRAKPRATKAKQARPIAAQLEVPAQTPVVAEEKPTSGSLPVVDTLEAIRSEVAACTACAELACTRKQTVFGVGNPHARLCFLGEAPGADEDAQGEPFVGRAGQLLTKIIEACTLRREDVYILNVLKCRPPGNRNPLPLEVANCRDFLDRQLALIKPEFICCLGTIAAQTLLQTDTPISRLRGKFVDYKGIPVMCTYHPAYLLRNPSAKKDVWEDMKVLLRRMGIELDKK